LPEALEILADETLDVMPLAGGTNVIVELRERHWGHKVLMDVSRLDELQGIHQQNGHIVMGGGTRLADLLTDPLIAQHGLPLKQAAAVLGSPLIRNRATVAGNLVDASPAADTAPPLLILDAEVELVSQDGSRHVPLNAFFLGPNQTVRQPQELLVTIRWPMPSSKSLGAFHKIGLRKALACSVATTAVTMEMDDEGLCRNIRIALGAVAPTPMRAFAGEEALEGKRPTPEFIAEAARLSAQSTRPIDDVRATAAYRRLVVEVTTRRLLTQVSSVSSQGQGFV
jgi:carbon-monoxide dehydrogenase medium subunit